MILEEKETKRVAAYFSLANDRANLWKKYEKYLEGKNKRIIFAVSVPPSLSTMLK
jgi:hypothetical protein